jgi:sugar/nucleoside kinase (ribokinase family)
VLLTDAFWPRANEKQLLRAACERANEWGNTVIITRGAQGGVWCRAGHSAQRFAPIAAGDEDILGSIGAGDVFRAGLLWARLQHWDWERGLRFAAAAAALKCRLAGAMPQLGQIEAVL